MAPKIVFADTLRALAIFAVFAHHALLLSGFTLHGQVFQMDWLGYWGVDSFFVLSGFLLAPPYLLASLGERSPPSFRLFAARRFFRIYPLYFVALLVSVAFASAAGEVPSAGDLVAHLFMLHGFFAQFVASINGPMWTMAVDAQFYVVLPILGAFAEVLLRGLQRKKRILAIWSALLFLVVGSLAFRWFALAYLTPGSMVDFSPVAVYARNVLGMGSDFALGAMLAFLGISAPKTSHGQAWYVAAILLGLLCAFAQAWKGWIALIPLGANVPPVLLQMEAIDFLGGCSAALVLYGFVHGRFARLGAVLGRRSIATLAALAYGIYLFHFPIMSWVASLTARQTGGVGRTLLVASLSLAIVLPIALIAHRTVERPFLDLRDRRRETVPTVP